MSLSPVHAWSRRAAKSAVASTLYRAGALAPSWNRGRTPLVLGYHRVVEDFATEAARGIPPMLVSVQMLEQHLDWLGRRYEFVGLDELGVRLSANAFRAKPLAAVTFDDGYRDVYDLAFPLLRRKGIPAGIFVVTSQIDTDRLLWHDRAFYTLSRAFAEWRNPAQSFAGHLAIAGVAQDAARQVERAAGDAAAATSLMQRTMPQRMAEAVLDRIEEEVGPPSAVPDGVRPMTWGMVKALRLAGFTIGSHTHRHVLLSRESAEDAAAEAMASRMALEARLGTTIDQFAYPDGHFNRASLETLATSGYRYAYTTCSCRDAAYPLLTIPRRILWERSSVNAAGEFSPAILYCQAQGILTGTQSCSRQGHE